MNVGDEEYDSGDEGNIIEEEERREREYFRRGDENFPLILSTTKGRPLVIDSHHKVDRITMSRRIGEESGRRV